MNLPLRTVLPLALIPLLLGATVALRAQVVSYTFSGMTTNHFTYLESFDTEFPGYPHTAPSTTGRNWTAVVSWDTGSSALFTNGTQAQYRLIDFSFTLSGLSGNWTTSAVANTASFTQNLDYYGDVIQFTTAWGPANVTNGSMFGFGPYSINLILVDPTFAAIDSLTPAPTFLDQSDWTLPASPGQNKSQLKIYLNNDANRYVIGNIQSISVTGSGGGAAIPEPSTYAALAGLAALGLVMWRRRALAD
jgi:hypothetical protein